MPQARAREVMSCSERMLDDPTSSRKRPDRSPVDAEARLNGRSGARLDPSILPARVAADPGVTVGQVAGGLRPSVARQAALRRAARVGAQAQAGQVRLALRRGQTLLDQGALVAAAAGALSAALPGGVHRRRALAALRRAVGKRHRWLARICARRRVRRRGHARVGQRRGIARIARADGAGTLGRLHLAAASHCEPRQQSRAAEPRAASSRHAEPARNRRASE